MPESNRRMAERLAGLAAEMEVHTNPMATAQQVAFYRQIEDPPDLRSRVRFAGRLAHVLLADGQIEAAVETLEQAKSDLEDAPRLFDTTFRRGLKSLLAAAYLRLGEQENCVEGHNAEACLLPIRGGGVHQRPRGARAALDLYREILAEAPEDLESRWLMNIAAMALGEHPEGVPEPWRIQPQVYAAEREIPRFVDVAAQAGVADGRLSGGVVMDDLDGDGLLDLLVSSWGSRDPLKLYRNRGDGGFDDVTESAGLAGLTGGLNLISGDVDNDGRLDVLVLRGAWQGPYGRVPNSLLRNRGPQGAAPVVFEDITEAAGLLDFRPTQTAAFSDLDGDGRLDLVVGFEDGPPRLLLNRLPGDSPGMAGTPESPSENGARDLFFEDIFFEDASERLPEGVFAPGLGSFVKAVVATDLDLDGDPDLFFSRFGAPNVLLRNDGGSFADVTREAGVAEPAASFPALFLDYDNDGRQDLFVAGFAVDFLAARAPAVAADLLGESSVGERSRLFRNISEGGDLRFEDVSAAVGLDRVSLAMAAATGDLDGDGFPDLYLGTGAPDFRALVPNRMFLNRPGEAPSDRRFFDVSAAGGFAHLQKGHGIAFGDVDGDGDEDVYEVLGGAYRGDSYPNALFENPSGGPWNTLRLEGTTSNRSALGARLRLLLGPPEGTAQDLGAPHREVHRVVGTGGSFGAGSLQQEVGLGPGEEILAAEVGWPGGATETFRGFAPGRIYRLRQGTGEPAEDPSPSFQLGAGSSDAGPAADHEHHP